MNHTYYIYIHCIFYNHHTDYAHTHLVSTKNKFSQCPAVLPDTFSYIWLPLVQVYKKTSFSLDKSSVCLFSLSVYNVCIQMLTLWHWNQHHMVWSSFSHAGWCRLQDSACLSLSVKRFCCAEQKREFTSSCSFCEWATRNGLQVSRPDM